MTDSKLTLRECTDLCHWDDFVAASPQGNVFCRSAFLDSLGIEYDLWLVSRGDEPQVGAVILHRDREVLPAPFPFTMYQGILFSQAVAAMPPHQLYRRLPELWEYTLTELSALYDRLTFCLHYASNDLRGLQWFHYHEPCLGRVRMDMYYTGLLDLTPFEDFEAYLNTIRKVRRYEYRKALRDGLTVEVSQDVDTLNHLLRLTFQRQGLERVDDADPLVSSIVQAALEHQFGELLICRDGAGEVASGSFFLQDQRSGYYLFGANHPRHRGANSGTFLLLENIRRCLTRGIKYVDMCGINSPNRGDFKTSFNAAPVPYYVATWEHPSHSTQS